MEQLQDLPPQVRKALTAFVDACRTVFGADLLSVVLYGSAAEGRLRATSDVNTLLVLKRFERSCADALRPSLRAAHSAVNLTAMFLLDSEIELAADAFAVKFSDILSRHRILCGSDPFSGKVVSREATIARLRQALLNLRLRLRERYTMASQREEQLALVIAEVAGPIRACAHSLLRLEGHGAPSPRQALCQVVAGLADRRWDGVLDAISAAREQGSLPAGAADSLVFDLMDLVHRLHERATALS